MGPFELPEGKTADEANPSSSSTSLCGDLESSFLFNPKPMSEEVLILFTSYKLYMLKSSLIYAVNQTISLRRVSV